jgi:hypothetical protein
MMRRSIRPFIGRSAFSACACVGVAAAMLALMATRAAADPPPPLVLTPLPLLQPSIVNVSNEPTQRFGEAYAAVNPKNPNNIVATYNQDQFIRSCAAASVAFTDHHCDIVPAHIGGTPFVFPEPRVNFGLAFPDVATPQWFTCGVFTSFDRGETWQHVPIPGWPDGHPELKDQGDCAVAAAPDGSFYVTFDDLNWSSPSNALPTCGIGSTRSTDGGLTWGPVVLTGTACDGPKVIGDLDDGRVYEGSGGAIGPRATADPTTPPGNIGDLYFASTTDGASWTGPFRAGGGESGCTTPFNCTTTGFNVSGRNSAGKGTLAVSIRSTSASACTFLVGTGAPCLVFQYSTDAGASWTRRAVPAAATIVSAVQVAADPSTSGHYTVAGQNASGQFVAIQTADYGDTWSALGATVIDPVAFVKFHPWMNYSRTGVLGLTWSANQAAGGSGGSQPYKVYAAISYDGGATWPAGAIEVSNGTSPAWGTCLSASYNESDVPVGTTSAFCAVSDDYSHIILGPDVAIVSWADWRGNPGTSGCTTPPCDRAGYVSRLRFLNYEFGDFLQPINSDGSSIFKLGSTVPVKFQLSVKSINVDWASAKLTFAKVDNGVEGTEVEAVSTAAATSGDAFRYDPVAQQYIFNWGTKGLTKGTYKLTATLDDATTHSVFVSLK